MNDQVLYILEYSNTFEFTAEFHRLRVEGRCNRKKRCGFKNIQLCNDRATPPAGVRSKNGNLLTQEDLVRERWKEHFQEVLNRPAPSHQIIPEDCALAEDEDCLDIDTGPFTLEEVRAVIKHLKKR